MIVACLALTVAMGGSAYAALGKNSVDSKQIAPKAVASSEIAGKAIKGADIADGAVKDIKLADNAVTTAKIADGAVSGTELAPLSVGLEKLGITVVTRFVDSPLPDNGQRAVATATCPAGQVVVGGGASFAGFPAADPTAGDDLVLLSSRPALNLPGGTGDFPADGSGFNGWRVSAINPTGGPTDGATQVTSQAICLRNSGG